MVMLIGRSLGFGILGVFLAGGASAAEGFEVVSTSPGLNESNTPAVTPIAIDFSTPVDPAAIKPESVRVFGRWSGAVDGDLEVEADGLRIRFVPSRPFTVGDPVTVMLAETIASVGGETLPPGGYAFTFTTAAAPADMVFEEIAEYSPDKAFIRIYGGQASDLDADGWLDLSIVNENSDDVRVYMNNADGSGLLTGPVRPYAPVGNTPSPNEPADFDHDGLVDIVVANTQGDTISVLLGQGDGTFQPASHYENGASGRGLAVLDIDGDADPDIAATAFNADHIRLFVNDGAGGFTPREPIDVGPGERAMAAADMNADGVTDLVVSLFGAAEIVVLLGDGNGGFTPSGPFPAGGTVWMVVPGDIDLDGDMDLSTANGGAATGSILLGDGAGGLGAPFVVPAGGFCTATDLGDLDGDGDLDWVLSAFGGGEWRLYENMGSGDAVTAFELHTVFPAASNPGCALIADMDNDADLDLILLDELADLIHVMQNTSTPPSCPADVSGDGVVGSADLNIVLAWFGVGGAGDVDADGDTDSADLNAVLAAFGGACR